MNEISAQIAEDIRTSIPMPESAYHLRLDMTCRSCPLQFEGWYDGQTVYYRARHGKWRLELDGEVVDSGNDTHPDDIGVAVNRIWRALNGLLREEQAEGVAQAWHGGGA